MTTKDQKTSEDFSTEEPTHHRGSKKVSRVGYTRTSMYIPESLLNILKDVAWSKRCSLTKVMIDLIENYISTDEVKSIISKIDSLKREKD